MQLVQPIMTSEQNLQAVKLDVAGTGGGYLWHESFVTWAILTDQVLATQIQDLPLVAFNMKFELLSHKVQTVLFKHSRHPEREVLHG